MKIAVIGGGSWGTALAGLLGEKGHPVKLWIYENELVEILRETRENTYYLSGYTLPKTVTFSNSVPEVVHQADFVIIVVPSHVLRRVLSLFPRDINRQAIIVSATKGIEIDSLKRMSEIIRESLPEEMAARVAVLSGPSFATEVSQHLPTTVVLASEREEIAKKAQVLFNTPFFRTYTNTDLIGVELCGALKNVMAIAAGAADGLGFGNNTKAALITRGLAEMSRLGMALNANPLTFSGLSGMGDLILTCTSSMSRNYSTGFKLGQGNSLADIIAGRKTVAEGINTTRSSYQLSHTLGIDMPIIEKVFSILFEGKRPKDAVRELMTRSLKNEFHHINIDIRDPDNG